MTGARPFSIRRRLLAWLLVATAAFGALALVDTWREAERMATALADRVLAGSALVIAERASLDDTGQIAIEIPYGALEMLSSAAEDRVFYRVDGPPGRLVTGYGDLPVARALPGGEPAFADDVFRGEPVRVASLSRAASTGIDEVPVIVTVAETTTAREELTRAILMRSALRLLLMILGAALIVGIAGAPERLLSRTGLGLQELGLAPCCRHSPTIWAISSCSYRGWSKSSARASSMRRLAGSSRLKAHWSMKRRMWSNMTRSRLGLLSVVRIPA